MSVQNVQLGNIAAVRALNYRNAQTQPQIAQNFQTNYADRELKPRVDSDLAYSPLANKLNYYA